MSDIILNTYSDSFLMNQGKHYNFLHFTRKALGCSASRQVSSVVHGVSEDGYNSISDLSSLRYQWFLTLIASYCKMSLTIQSIMFRQKYINSKMKGPCDFDAFQFNREEIPVRQDRILSLLVLDERRNFCNLLRLIVWNKMDVGE